MYHVWNFQTGGRVVTAASVTNNHKVPFRFDQFEPVGSVTTRYQTGPFFCPQKDGKVNFHLQQKF